MACAGRAAHRRQRARRDWLPGGGVTCIFVPSAAALAGSLTTLAGVGLLVAMTAPLTVTSSA